MAVQLGISIFPLTLISTPIPGFAMEDSINQILELLSQQVMSNAPQQSNGGTFTANGTTSVTVTDTRVTANSVIAVTLKTVGGTVGTTPYVATITPGTGFTVIATASNTSVYNYAILG